MELYLQVLVFVFGLLIGSFLNVVLYRMHTGVSLSGHSHCLSCGTRLRAIDLVPLFSYLALRARCRSCKAFIPPRYFVVELLTACLFVWVWTTFSDLVVVLLSLVLISLLMVITVYDIRHTIIPDELTIMVGVGVLVLSGYQFYAGDITLEALGLRLVGALLATAFFAILWGASKGRWMGFGDVKLVFPLALMLGLSGTFTLIVLAFWIGAAISLVLMALGWLLGRVNAITALRLPPVTLKSEVPFAPFLITAWLLVYLAGVDILNIFSYGLL